MQKKTFEEYQNRTSTVWYVRTEAVPVCGFQPKFRIQRIADKTNGQTFHVIKPYWKVYIAHTAKNL
jgi:hypothetical protein